MEDILQHLHSYYDQLGATDDFILYLPTFITNLLTEECSNIQKFIEKCSKRSKSLTQFWSGCKTYQLPERLIVLCKIYMNQSTLYCFIQDLNKQTISEFYSEFSPLNQLYTQLNDFMHELESEDLSNIAISTEQGDLDILINELATSKIANEQNIKDEDTINNTLNHVSQDQNFEQSKQVDNELHQSVVKSTTQSQNSDSISNLNEIGAVHDNEQIQVQIPSSLPQLQEQLLDFQNDSANAEKLTNLVQCLFQQSKNFNKTVEKIAKQNPNLQCLETWSQLKGQPDKVKTFAQQLCDHQLHEDIIILISAICCTDIVEFLQNHLIQLTVPDPQPSDAAFTYGNDVLCAQITDELIYANDTEHSQTQILSQTLLEPLEIIAGESQKSVSEPENRILDQKSQENENKNEEIRMHPISPIQPPENAPNQQALLSEKLEVQQIPQIVEISLIPQNEQINENLQMSETSQNQQIVKIPKTSEKTETVEIPEISLIPEIQQNLQNLKTNKQKPSIFTQKILNFTDKIQQKTEQIKREIQQSDAYFPPEFSTDFSNSTDIFIDILVEFYREMPPSALAISSLAQLIAFQAIRLQPLQKLLQIAPADSLLYSYAQELKKRTYITSETEKTEFIIQQYMINNTISFLLSELSINFRVEDLAFCLERCDAERFGAFSESLERFGADFTELKAQIDAAKALRKEALLKKFGACGPEIAAVRTREIENFDLNFDFQANDFEELKLIGVENENQSELSVLTEGEISAKTEIEANLCSESSESVQIELVIGREVIQQKEGDENPFQFAFRNTKIFAKFPENSHFSGAFSACKTLEKPEFQAQPGTPPQLSRTLQFQHLYHLSKLGLALQTLAKQGELEYDSILTFHSIEVEIEVAQNANIRELIQQKQREINEILPWVEVACACGRGLQRGVVMCACGRVNCGSCRGLCGCQ
eukprot:EST48100.1 Hypothetical protein SS50377_11763 [Spironucleus salmonicida]